MLFMRFPGDLGKVDFFWFLTSKLVKMCYDRDLDVPSASQNVREFGQDLQELEGVYNFLDFSWVGDLCPLLQNFVLYQSRMVLKKFIVRHRLDFFPQKSSGFWRYSR